MPWKLIAMVLVTFVEVPSWQHLSRTLPLMLAQRFSDKVGWSTNWQQVVHSFGILGA